MRVGEFGKRKDVFGFECSECGADETFRWECQVERELHRSGAIDTERALSYRY